MTSHTENARTLAACSTCGAEDGKPCRYPSGDVRAPHKSRDELAPAAVEPAQLFEHEKTYPNAGVVRVTCSKSGGGFELGLRSLSGPECVDCEECGQQISVGPLSVEWVGRLYKRQDGRSANAALQRHIAAAQSDPLGRRFVEGALVGVPAETSDEIIGYRAQLAFELV